MTATAALVTRLLAVWALIGSDAAATQQQQQQQPPKTNFVVLFADDFGWGDLASYGHPTQERGRIDQLADDGVRFTQWYSSESICTPSRMGLVTG